VPDGSTAENSGEQRARVPAGGDERPPGGAPRRASGEPSKVEEIGGPKGPEPTRYGDWEKGGRCTDF